MFLYSTPYDSWSLLCHLLLIAGHCYPLRCGRRQGAVWGAVGRGVRLTISSSRCQWHLPAHHSISSLVDQQPPRESVLPAILVLLTRCQWNQSQLTGKVNFHSPFLGVRCRISSSRCQRHLPAHHVKFCRPAASSGKHFACHLGVIYHRSITYCLGIFVSY